MGKRTEPRSQRALPVRVLGMDVNGRPILETVQTVNISRHGVVIEGLRSRVNLGEVVSLQYKDRKVRYRVVWEGDPNSERIGQFGLEQVNLHDDLWQKDLPPAPPTGRDRQVRGQDRRKHHRYEAHLPVEMHCAGATPARAESGDISLSGCYVNTLFPPPVDTMLTLAIWLGNQRLAVRSRVRTSVLGVGCGIEFLDLSEAYGKQLEQFLKLNCKQVSERRNPGAGKPPAEANAAPAEIPTTPTAR